MGKSRQRRAFAAGAGRRRRERFAWITGGARPAALWRHEESSRSASRSWSSD